MMTVALRQNSKSYRIVVDLKDVLKLVWELKLFDPITFHYVQLHHTL